MRAVVLVGGFGTRLRPLTLGVPKQMLPVVDRPMIDWVLSGLAGHGVDEAVLSLGYRPDAFRDAYPDDRGAGVRLRYVVEPEPLGTAGAVRFAAVEAGIDERFVVVNGDVLTTLDLSALVAFHDARGADATIAVHEVDDPFRFGVVVRDDHGRVEAFVEKPPAGTARSRHINAGTYVLEPGVLDHIEPGRRVSIERETFPVLVERGAVYALDDAGVYWLDSGTPATFLQANIDAAEGHLGAPTAPAVDPSAQVSPSATLHRAIIGPGVSVGDGAVVDEAVVLAGAVIGHRAIVRRSIVGPRARVGDGAEITELTVLGHGSEVAAGERLEGVKRPEDGPRAAR